MNELGQFGQNFEFKIVRDHGKNFLGAAFYESQTIGAYLRQCHEKIDERNNSGRKGLIKKENSHIYLTFTASLWIYCCG